MAFDFKSFTKLKPIVDWRPRLLPTAATMAALAVPLYAATMATRFDGASAQVSTPEAVVPAAATAAAAAPPPAPLAKGFTDLLAQPDPQAPAPAEAPARCDPALADLLATERQSLSDRQAELDLRAQMLAAAEKKAGEQLARLEQARQDVSGLLDRRASMAKADLQRLVSIYESMKPKDAARLLNETDVEILVDLLDLMQERRSAPILAEMEATKVNQLTRTLALRRVLPADRPKTSAKSPTKTASLNNP